MNLSVTADDERWRPMLNMHATMDEALVGVNGPSIRAAIEGLFLKLFVYSTYPLGYEAIPVPNEFTKTGKVRTRLGVSDATAKWVRQIFAWFVVDRLDRVEIVRRLNADQTAPVVG